MSSISINIGRTLRKFPRVTEGVSNVRVIIIGVDVCAAAFRLGLKLFSKEPIIEIPPIVASIVDSTVSRFNIPIVLLIIKRIFLSQCNP